MSRSISVYSGGNYVTAALPDSKQKRSKRKAAPEEAITLRKKACTAADGPKVCHALLVLKDLLPHLIIWNAFHLPDSLRLTL